MSSKMDKKLIKIVVYGLNHHEFVTAVRYGFDILIVSFFAPEKSSSLISLSSFLSFIYIYRQIEQDTHTLLRLQSKERNKDKN